MMTPQREKPDGLNMWVEAFAVGCVVFILLLLASGFDHEIMSTLEGMGP